MFTNRFETQTGIVTDRLTGDKWKIPYSEMEHTRHLVCRGNLSSMTKNEKEISEVREALSWLEENAALLSEVGVIE